MGSIYQYLLPALLMALLSLIEAGPPGCTPCNDAIDKILVETNADIKSRSPLKKKDKDYCRVLALNGAYTMIRYGDICGVKLDGPDECYKQDIGIVIQTLNFTCDVDMAMVTDAMQKYGNDPSKAMDSIKQQSAGKLSVGRKRRGFGLGDLDVPDEAKIIGIWKEVCIKGTMTVCRKDQSKSDLTNIGLCHIEITNCELTCDGDPTLESMCQQDAFIKKFKEGLGAIVEVVAQGEIRNSLLNSPSNLGEKFRCG